MYRCRYMHIDMGIDIVLIHIDICNLLAASIRITRRFTGLFMGLTRQFIRFC